MNFVNVENEGYTHFDGASGIDDADTFDGLPDRSCFLIHYGSIEGLQVHHIQRGGKLVMTRPRI